MYIYVGDKEMEAKEAIVTKVYVCIYINIYLYMYIYISIYM
jgi:hypothetical protein